MAAPLPERHPVLMVPYVFTFGVVVYTNGGQPIIPDNLIREALISGLDKGCGVGAVTSTCHGIYEPADKPT